MRVGKYEITGGPNWQFYFVTALIVYWAWSGWTIWPIIGWIVFWIIMVPLCIWLTRYNDRANEQMLRDFPDDSHIQRKYGRKVDKT